MTCRLEKKCTDKKNDFYYAQKYIEKVRHMIAEGKINPSIAVQKLDREFKNFGDFKDYYEENRMKVIDSLFLN